MSIEHSELDKMQAVREQSQAIGEFLDWLTGTKGLFICEMTGKLEANWSPVSRTINQWLAEYFQIDLYQVDREQKALLESLRTKTTPEAG